MAAEYKGCALHCLPLCIVTLAGTRVYWVTLTFDLAFCWAKVRSQYRLKSKSKVIALSESLSPNFGSLDLAEVWT